MRIANVLVDFLTTDSVNLHAIDFEDPEISDYNMIPNSVLLSDRLRVCLQESDEVPTDFTRLFNTRLFSISTSLVPPAIKASQFSAKLRERTWVRSVRTKHFAV